MAEFVRVMDEADLAAGSNKAVEAFGQSVLLCRTTDGIYAIANECTHQKTALEGGRQRGTAIFCPEHGVRFDLRTGCPTGTLTNIPVRRFKARIADGGIEVSEREPDI